VIVAAVRPVRVRADASSPSLTTVISVACRALVESASSHAVFILCFCLSETWCRPPRPCEQRQHPVARDRDCCARDHRRWCPCSLLKCAPSTWPS